MQIAIGDFQVNTCSVPAFMGHEEIVLPMLVLRSSKSGRADKLGGFWHCLNDQFQPNDLSNTAVAGYLSGLGHKRINLEKIFVGDPYSELGLDNWKPIPEISAALDTLGSSYAFFLEKSASPFQDAFIHRCRFIAGNRLCDFRPRMDLTTETGQTSVAKDILSAFLRAFCSRLDDEVMAHDINFDGGLALGYAIWLEQEGVVRAWTRVTYVPK